MVFVIDAATWLSDASVAIKNAIFPFTYPLDSGIDTALDEELLLEGGDGAIAEGLFVCSCCAQISCFSRSCDPSVAMVVIATAARRVYILGFT